MARRGDYGGYDMYERRGRGHHDRHGRSGRHHGGSSWWVWVVVAGAIYMWASGQDDGKSTPSRTPERGGVSTVCTEQFKGGC